MIQGFKDSRIQRFKDSIIQRFNNSKIRLLQKMAKTFEEMEVWQKARKLCEEVYLCVHTAEFSKDYELKNQINRSSGSVMDNIAEGFERNNNKEFIYFLYVSKGSVGETRSQLYRAFDRAYITQTKHDELNELCLQISQQLSKFTDYLKKSEHRGYKHIIKTETQAQ